MSSTLAAERPCSTNTASAARRSSILARRSAGRGIVDSPVNYRKAIRVVKGGTGNLLHLPVDLAWFAHGRDCQVEKFGRPEDVEGEGRALAGPEAEGVPAGGVLVDLGEGGLGLGAGDGVGAELEAGFVEGAVIGVDDTGDA